MKKFYTVFVALLAITAVAAISRTTSVFNSIAIKNSTTEVGKVLVVLDADGNIGYTTAGGGGATNAILSINGQTNFDQTIAGGDGITVTTNGTGTSTVTSVAVVGNGTNNTLTAAILTGGAIFEGNVDLSSAIDIFETVLVTDESGIVHSSSVSSNELSFVDGVTNPIQTQINALLTSFGITVTNVVIVNAKTANPTNTASVSVANQVATVTIQGGTNLVSLVVVNQASTNLTNSISAGFLDGVLSITNLNATNYFGPTVTAGGNVTVTPTTNAFGHIAFSVASTGGGGDGIPTLNGNGTNTTLYASGDGNPAVLADERQLNNSDNLTTLDWENLALVDASIGGSSYNWGTGSMKASDGSTETLNHHDRTLTGGWQTLLTGSPGTDDTWSGSAIVDLAAGETVAQWELVRMHSDGAWHLADADAAGEFPAIGIASNGADAGTNINVVVSGTIRNDAWSWTVGGSLYLSATVGGLTQTAPTTSGHAVQRVGVALSADSAYLNFSGEWGVNE